MKKEIDLQEYYEISLSSRDEAYAKAAELLGLSPDSTEQEIQDYITSHYEWYRYDMEEKYMGYDCGDCYMGGDVKKGIVCGDYFVIYAACPNYKLMHIYKKR